MQNSPFKNENLKYYNIKENKYFFEEKDKERDH